MDSSPRRWVLKPLSPLLQPSDLRTMAGPAPGLDRWDSGSLVVLQENGRSLNGLMEVQHVTVMEDGDSEDWHPSSPCSSSGSQSGFYSFVEDPTSPEAELNEAWMVSPQRQAQLAVLKKERGFKLQTYSSNKKPESLFSESNGDSLYRADPNNGMTLMDEDEEKQFRKMIIHSQAPKRSQTEAQTHGGAVEPKLSTDRLIEGLSLRFSPAAAADPPPAEPGTVVKEQIDFGAARQKFLQMEQDQRAVMLSPGRSPTAKLNLTAELDADVYVSRKVKIFGTTNGTDDTPLKPAEKDEAAFHRKVTVFQSEGRLSRESSVFDHLDSDHDSLSHEGVGGYTSNDSQLEEPHQDDWNKPRVFQETPIEREIRLTQEREEELRRSRGLKHSVGREEMVRIKTSSSRLSLTSDRTFEKNPVSFIIHSKIRKEEDPQEPERRGAPPQPDPQDEKRRTGDRLESDSGADDVFLSPCSSSSTPHVSVTPTTLHGPQGWRKSLASTGLQSRGQGTPDFIEKEIEESLKRELELRELRESMKKIRWKNTEEHGGCLLTLTNFLPVPFRSHGPVSLLEMIQTLLESVKDFTKWSHIPSAVDPLTSASFLSPLTPCLLFQVVESTRVARHKNQRALLWEAGLFWLNEQ
uniref:A-kinase anchor protein 2 C-terminal domain-containing protein n=1 Tax=Fundulus heteroclitus TaxID=8078 RepID=A0A3Q2Q3A4_FUNHE